MHRAVILFYMEWLEIGFTKMVTSEKRLHEGGGVSHLDIKHIWRKVFETKEYSICKGPEQGSFDLLYSSKESRVPHGG